jgi:hypothetical protein
VEAYDLELSLGKRGRSDQIVLKLIFKGDYGLFVYCAPVLALFSTLKEVGDLPPLCCCAGFPPRVRLRESGPGGG